MEYAKILLRELGRRKSARRLKVKAIDRIELGKDGCKFFLGGKEVPEAEYRKVYPLPETGEASAADRRGGCDAWRKFESHALAVHPRQVAEANARAKRHGIAVQYDPLGVAQISGPAARKELMKLEAFHDESGYGGVYG